MDPFQVSYFGPFGKAFLIFLCLGCMAGVSYLGYLDNQEFIEQNAVSETLFAFEIVRHGARAPLTNANGFKVAKEMLTPMGMRQRYLLGKYMSLKSINSYYGFVDKEQELKGYFDGVYVYSTNYYRTI